MRFGPSIFQPELCHNRTDPLPTRELVGGLIGDFWRSRGGAPNLVFRTLFGIAALIATVSVFAVAYVRDPVIVVVDRMLERAREVTRNGEYTYIEYARILPTIW